MKKVLAFMLSMAVVAPFLLSVGKVAGAEQVSSKPFYGLTWSAVDRELHQYLDDAPSVSVKETDGVVYLSYGGETEPAKIAEKLKETVDAMPEGMRYIRIFNTGKAFGVAPEHVVYLDKGVDQLKDVFTAVIQAYYAIGGKLEGIILDTEYILMGNWYVYSREYYQNNKITNTQIYNQIVADPRYQTEIRPLLVERGFTFWKNPSGEKSEIYSIWPHQRMTAAQLAEYGHCAGIWNTVMRIRIAQYLNESIYEPARALYPDVVVSDYQTKDNSVWLKVPSSTEPASVTTGNSMKAGNASNTNTYLVSPGDGFFTSDGTYLYQKPHAYNGADFERDSYNMFMWDVNRFKNMYASTDTELITAWICEYDYTQKAGSANTAYYTETILHLGLLDPQPFLVYIYRGSSKYSGENGVDEYNKRMQVIAEILKELTRVAGFSDRKPIQTPASWNDGYVLSGMYAGGRNIWRLTPDTTDGMTLENFRIAGADPTFSINGTTITFPGGKIITDGEVSVVGTAGYWIETAKDVHPVVTRSENRYKESPSYLEDFECYAVGTTLNATNAAKPQTWELSGTAVIQAYNGDKMLALSGSSTLKNVKLPKNITAGDSYAKQQAWEVSFVVAEEMSSTGYVKLLHCGANGGVKIEAGKLYYDHNGALREFGNFTLAVGQKYTVVRELDLRVSGAYLNSYFVYDAEGKLLASAKDVPLRSMTVPVEAISVSSNKLTTKVYLDDYKLYPTGLATDMEVYDGDYGKPLILDEKVDSKRVAYRLSWLNGTGEIRKMNVRAALYDAAGALISDTVVDAFEMAPGWDGVEVGIVENTAAQIVVYLEDAGAYTPPAPTTTPTTVPTTAPTTQPTTAPTTQPTTAPTTQPTTAPTTQPTTAPTTQPTTAPTTQPTTAPTTQPTTAPTTQPTTAPTTQPTTAPTTQPTTAPTTQPTTQPSTATKPSTAPSEPVEDNEGGNTGAIIVAVAVVVIGAAAGTWFFLKKKKG